nr:DUF4837 family protein [uncultured Carboxylicivirga sp.]
MRNYLSKSNILQLSAALVVSVIFIAVSCKNTVNEVKPRALGAPGEVLLVIDNDNWNSAVGDTLDVLLSDIFPALPQAENMFRKTRIEFSKFQRHFCTYRNILLVSVRPNIATNKVQFKRNEWAIDQQVAEVMAKDASELEDLIIQKWPKIKSFFYNGDIDALVKSYNRVYEPTVVDMVKKEYPFSLYFPKGFELKKKQDGFTWIVNERIDNQLGVFVFQFSLDSIKNTDAQALLALRNKVLSEQVPGQYPGSYMTTEENYPVHVTKCKFAGRKWTELRGLWKVQGDFMGGPFVDYFFADAETNKLIMLEGYVYAPSKPNKANFVREVEAVLKTFMPV